MKILDYIFKNREQREKEAKEAEEKRNLELSSLADKLYKEKKYDECLKVCMELVNKDFCGLGIGLGCSCSSMALLAIDSYQSM